MSLKPLEMQNGDFIDSLLPEAKLIQKAKVKPSSNNILEQALNDKIAGKEKEKTL